MAAMCEGLIHLILPGIDRDIDGGVNLGL